MVKDKMNNLQKEQIREKPLRNCLDCKHSFRDSGKVLRCKLGRTTVVSYGRTCFVEKEKTINKKEQVKKGTKKDLDEMFKEIKPSPAKILYPYNQKKKEQVKTTNEKFIELYLSFKSKCLNQGIEDIDEIIKLFEVWARNCS